MALSWARKLAGGTELSARHNKYPRYILRGGLCPCHKPSQYHCQCSRLSGVGQGKNLTQVLIKFEAKHRPNCNLVCSYTVKKKFAHSAHQVFNQSSALHNHQIGPTVSYRGTHLHCTCAAPRWPCLGPQGSLAICKATSDKTTSHTVQPRMALSCVPSMLKL